MNRRMPVSTYGGVRGWSRKASVCTIEVLTVYGGWIIIDPTP